MLDDYGTPLVKGHHSYGSELLTDCWMPGVVVYPGSKLLISNGDRELCYTVRRTFTAAENGEASITLYEPILEPIADNAAITVSTGRQKDRIDIYLDDIQANITLASGYINDAKLLGESSRALSLVQTKLDEANLWLEYHRKERDS